MGIHASVAQWIECVSTECEDVGSSPTAGIKNPIKSVRDSEESLRIYLSKILAQVG